MWIGAADPVVQLASCTGFEEARASAGVDWQINLYGGVRHSFTHPRCEEMGIPGLEYDQLATRRSWKAMTDLFNEVL